MTTRLKLGHSPDSDDAFMFYGLAAHKVESEGIEFEHILEDIQTLNEWAREGRIDCTAISVHAYAYVRDRYAILTHGASMGDGYGPMIVARRPMQPEDLVGKILAVPGTMTSAFLAANLYLAESGLIMEPATGQASASRSVGYVVTRFDHIMEAVHAGEVDAGLIIHEGQLTHRAEGLDTLVDLGAWWKEATGLPLPLGVNAIRRDLPGAVQKSASIALKASIVYGLEHRAQALDHAMTFARDMERATADAFVGMYVNEWTVDMGEAGREAIRLFLRRGEELGLVPRVGDVLFVD